MRRLQWQMIGVAVLGICVGALGATALAVYSDGVAAPFWRGKGAEWAGVLVGTVAAIATLLAIWAGLTASKRAIEAERALRDEERAFANSARRTQAAIVASSAIDELGISLAQLSEIEECYEDDRCKTRQREILGLADAIELTRLEQAVSRCDLFEKDDGIKFGRAFAALSHLKTISAYNKDQVSGWAPHVREARWDGAKSSMPRHLGFLTDAFKAAWMLANDGDEVVAKAEVEKKIDLGRRAYAKRCEAWFGSDQ